MSTLKRVYRLVKAAGEGRVLELASSQPVQADAMADRKAEGGNPCRGSAATGDLPPLPCLNSNNCTKDEIVQSNHRKTAYALKENIRLMAERHGVEKLGFLTLTFADQVKDIKVAQQRFHSLRTHVLVRYEEWIAVVERQKSGAVHFHLVIVVGVDIKTGFNFPAHKEARKAWNRWKLSGNKDLDSLTIHKMLTKLYSMTATKRLREEWAFWLRRAPRFHFGRCELTPIRTNANGISRYLGKYVSKHIGQRKPEDKGIRLVRYSGCKRDAAGQVVVMPSNRVCCRFSWLSPGARLHRLKLGAFGQVFGCNSDNYQERFKRWFGSKWGYHTKEVIASIKLPAYPSLATFLLDYPHLKDEPRPEGSENTPGAREGFSDESRQTILNAWVVGEDLRSRRRHYSDKTPLRSAVQYEPPMAELEPCDPWVKEEVPKPCERMLKSWVAYSAKED